MPRVTTSQIEASLRALGLALPSPAAPAANYIPFTKVGPLVFVSGQIPKLPDGTMHKGKVGDSYTVERAQEAARVCALNIVAQIKEACKDGELAQVKKIVKLEGFVSCGAEFTEHPEVINGASDLLVDLFGPDVGPHSRFAVGCASLPRGVPVEIGAVVELDG
ncbi:unnamed protein product [Amoebophrya sp. A120]|nr:unnamed protein product [Amoebophrya sp. A120]|eukprot:GSA120T00001359001.1